MLSDLNFKFGIPEAITFLEGKGGMTKALLRHSSGAEAEVYLHGAHITSWRSPKLGELLFTSKKAEFKPDKAIRGGIPLIFPQFGAGTLPSHGIARNISWQPLHSEIDVDGNVHFSLVLNDSEQTRSMWPHAFEVTYSVVLSDRLDTSLTVSNKGSDSLEFQLALHTYFKVSNIANATVKGFGGLKFFNNLENRKEGQEERSEIKIQEEVDRIYQSAPEVLELTDSGRGFRILIAREDLRDAVLWNPWIEKTKRLSDMDAEEYKEFVCIESGNILPPERLSAGESFSCLQTLHIVHI